VLFVGTKEGDEAALGVETKGAELGKGSECRVVGGAGECGLDFVESLGIMVSAVGSELEGVCRALARKINSPVEIPFPRCRCGHGLTCDCVVRHGSRDGLRLYTKSMRRSQSVSGVC
jgi:hypothetical protein